jgi:hypothetical protein
MLQAACTIVIYLLQEQYNSFYFNSPVFLLCLLISKYQGTNISQQLRFWLGDIVGL